MALWVSLLNWDGQSNPFTSTSDFVGLRNYADLLVHPGLPNQLLGISLRNNFYYVLFVVPIQTALALGLALFLNRRRLRARGFFRTAFYFPSVTSTVAISTVFLFVFQTTGVVNTALKQIGINGPNWFDDPQGVFLDIYGALGLTNPNNPTGPLAAHGFLGLNWWGWLAGPSVALCTLIVLAVWTTSGTFMLIFLAALQDIPVELEEAARIDGANGWQVFRNVTLPALKPVMFVVLTLGFIGTWQVFDSVFVMSQGGPVDTTMMPAYLSYVTGFENNQYGQASAIAFILFAIIIAITLVQRWLMRERRTKEPRVARASKARTREVSS